MNEDSFTPKIPIEFVCNVCSFNCRNKKDYNRHLMTAKHRMRINRTGDLPPNTPHVFTCECGKQYKYKRGLWNHRQKCITINKERVEDTITQVPINDSNLIIELLKQNNEFKNLMVEQSKQIQEQNKQVIELAKNSGNTTNNTINNTTNNRFNLNVFLNETCKDAMNLNDFIQSIELNMNDFINTGEVGYVKGISNIMVERIRDMEPHVRPIHCTDLKRETVYVKDSNKWAKEDDNKTHIRKAVRIVADKNQAQVHPWIKENPNYEILDTPECDKYFEYTKASLGGYGREEDMKFENKIINNILKETVIDKNLITND
jgi:hypothetical protein